MKKRQRRLLFCLLMLSMSLLIVACSKNAETNVQGIEGEGQVSVEETDESSQDSVSKEVDANTNANENVNKEEEDNDEASYATTYPYTFTDKFGQDITIEKEPETIVSLSPEITETLYAIGAQDAVIGRSTYDDYPEEVTDLPDMGTVLSFNLETLVEADPDVIFLSSMVSESTYQELIDAGLTPVIFDYDQTLVGTTDLIDSVAAIVNHSKEALAIDMDIMSTLATIKAKAVDREAKSVYFVVSAGGGSDSAATGDTYIGDMIEATGAINAAADGSDWMYSIEELVEKDPDILICSDQYDMKTTIETTEGYKDLTAVKEGRLYEVEENIFYRQGPRVVEALNTLDDILYGSEN